MSKEFQRFSSSQNVSQEATQQKKITKVGARYIQLEEFRDSDHHRGYFCYNCVYFVKPHHCAIVTDEGIDIQVIHQVLLLLMDYVQYGHRTKKRYMEIHLQEDLVQLLLKYLQVAYQMNQPLESLLNSHVTSVMRLSIQERH